MNRTRRLFLFLPALLASGCGFQLRGSTEWPQELTPIYIDGLGVRNPLYLILAQRLRGAGVEVLSSRSPEAAVLQVLFLGEERRVLSVTGAARISEYELTRVLETALRIPGEPEAVPLGRLQANRVYVFDAASVLSQREREDELARAMDRDLVRLLQLRVQAVMRAREEAGAR